MYRIFTLCDLRLQVSFLVNIHSMCVSVKYQFKVTKQSYYATRDKEIVFVFVFLSVCLLAYMQNNGVANVVAADTDA